MRKSLSLLVFFLAISSVLFVGCKKHAALDTGEPGPDTDLGNDISGRQEMPISEAKFRLAYTRDVSTIVDLLDYSDIAGWNKTYNYQSSDQIGMGLIETANLTLIDDLINSDMKVYSEASGSIVHTIAQRPLLPLKGKTTVQRTHTHSLKIVRRGLVPLPLICISQEKVME